MEIDFAARIHGAYKAAPLINEIHPNDVMFNTGKPWYFSVGENGLRMILTGLMLSWKQQVSRILDLPCGHGRIGRHLRAAFPKAEIFFCDLDSEGVDFCASHFAGTAVYSQPDLTKVDLPRDLDVIWIGSLFTHLDRARTAAWIEYLTRHLSEHGILVATFHGYFSAEHRLPGGGADRDEAVRQMHETGFGYSRYKTYESDYGFSLSKPTAIMEIANIPGTRILSYTERGWANNHDVLVLCRHDRLKAFGA